MLSTRLRAHLQRLLLALLLGALLPSLTFADPARATPAPEIRAERLALLADPRINESSGLCLSRHTPDRLWTLNDSGGPATLFALDRQGRTTAEIHVKGALNLDWEDLASGPGLNGQPALFIADIGDNLQLRPHVTIYEIAEPPPVEGSSKALSLRPSRVWRLRYPDGAANAETLLCHPQSGQLYILTKTPQGEAVLHAVPPHHRPGKIQRTEEIARVHFPDLPKKGKRPSDNRMTTGGCLSCDGTRLVVATYSSLYEWSLPDATLTPEALSQPPVRIDPPLTRQMEAVWYDHRSPSLLFTSEILPAPLYRIQRPTPR